jgi:putative SOS response-associated peptidase YedK
MCGRFTLRTRDRIKVKGLRTSDLPFEARFNIAPSQSILPFANFGNGLDLRYLVWGLVPSWSKDGKGFINARSETIEDKPSFSESFQRRRCLIPADGFYEWERSGKIAQPYLFQMRDESPFAFAGIWEEWQVDGNSIASCAIITTTANELIGSIHDLICTNSVKALEVQTGLTHLVSPELGQEFDLLGVLRDEVDD